MCVQHIYKQQKLNPKCFPARETTKIEQSQLQVKHVEIKSETVYSRFEGGLVMDLNMI